MLSRYAAVGKLIGSQNRYRHMLAGGMLRLRGLTACAPPPDCAIPASCFDKMHCTLWMQVVLSPQRPRTIISFENRCWSSDGPGSKPVLTMFPHTEGAKVSEP